jgi:hypothetical protein
MEMSLGLICNQANRSILQSMAFGIIIASNDKCYTLGAFFYFFIISALSFFKTTLFFFASSVIAVNLLQTDEILRAGRSSLKPEGEQ